ncbi:MAG: NHLP-related RiPP peptide [Acidobacteriota bacterium]
MQSIVSTPSSSASVPVDLLRRLAEDDAFRAQVEADPIAAFASMGVHLDPADVPQEITLPKREACAFWISDDLRNPLKPQAPPEFRGLLG